MSELSSKPLVSPESLFGRTIEEVIKKWSTKGITLDGQDAIIIPCVMDHNSVIVRTVAGDLQKVFSLTAADSIVKERKGCFTGGYTVTNFCKTDKSSMISDKVTKLYDGLFYEGDEEEESDVVETKTTVVQNAPVSVPEMMGFIHKDSITFNGVPARIGIAFITESTPIPKILDLQARKDYFLESWERVREVVDNEGGNFSIDDTIDILENGEVKPKIKLSAEEILKLCQETEITLDGIKAEVKLINDSSGCISTIEEGEKKRFVSKRWTHIYNVVTNHLGKFFINDTNKYTKTNTSKSTNSYQTLHSSYNDALDGTKKTKEALTKIMGLCVASGKDDPFMDVQVLYKEFSKLELYLELSKDTHGGTQVNW